MFYLIYGPLYLLSLLPLRVLFLLSDVAYFFIYYVFGYRKKVVMENLSIAFPQKTVAERKAIAKKFYRNFTDTFIETIKFLSATPAFINQHFQCDYTVFYKIFERDKKCQIHTSHNFNWELANLGLGLNVPHTLIVVYQPIENTAVDKLFLKMRTRTGSILLPATNMRKAIIAYRAKLYALGLVADQNPGNFPKAWWAPFFGRLAPFASGPENGARIANIPVVFGYFTKTKRGYYKGEFHLAEDNPASLPKGELTLRYIAYMERVIKESPEMWLWSHRRWKHEYQPEYKLLTAPHGTEQ